jgi:hypothetical protein
MLVVPMRNGCSSGDRQSGGASKLIQNAYFWGIAGIASKVVSQNLNGLKTMGQVYASFKQEVSQFWNISICSPPHHHPLRVASPSYSSVIIGIGQSSHVTTLVVRNSSMPCVALNRPHPLFFTPPNGNPGSSLTVMLLICTALGQNQSPIKTIHSGIALTRTGFV